MKLQMAGLDSGLEASGVWFERGFLFAAPNSKVFGDEGRGSFHGMLPDIVSPGRRPVFRG